MNSIESLKAIRERRERLFRRSNPRVREFEMQKDAWVLWGAYDLGSFPNLKKGLKQEEFFAFLGAFAKTKSSMLLVDEDHKYFREKRGPVALVSIDNYGWRIEPQFDFFFWATPRHRLAAVVSFLNMVRYSKDVGVCVVRADERDRGFCEHLYKYDLLRPVGKIPNAGPSGAEYLYCLAGRKSKTLELVADNTRRAA